MVRALHVDQRELQLMLHAPISARNGSQLLVERPPRPNAALKMLQEVTMEASKAGAQPALPLSLRSARHKQMLDSRRRAPQ